MTVSQTQTVRPLVRRDSCRIAADALDVTCPISPGVIDRERSFFFFHAATQLATAEGASVRCSLDTATAITCSRRAATGVVNIAWQLVELPEGIRVQHLGPIPCTASKTSVPITSVDPAKTFVLFSSSQTGGTLGGNDFATVFLQSSTQVDITTEGGCADNLSSLQVVQLDAIQVSRGITGPMNAVLLDSMPQPNQGPAETFVQTTYRISNQGPGSCDRMVRGAVKNPTMLSFTRGAGTDCKNASVTLAWERITLSQAKLQTNVLSLSATESSVERILSSAVNPQRAVVFASSQSVGGQGIGETAYSADQGPGAAMGQLGLSPTGDKVTVKRDLVGAPSIWTSYVIQFGP